MTATDHSKDSAFRPLDQRVDLAREFDRRFGARAGMQTKSKRRWPLLTIMPQPDSPSTHAPLAPFVVLEGIDGSGTTSQVRRIAARLTTQGHRVHATAEPSQGAIGQHLRQILAGHVPCSDATMALLFAADRLDHVEREIQVHRAAGTIVLCDRYLASSLAYQTLHLPRSWVESLNKYALAPSLTVLLDLPPSIALARRQARGGPQEVFDDEELQRRVAAHYSSMVANPGLAGPIEVVDGAADLHTVTDSIWTRLEPHLNGWRSATGQKGAESHA